MEILVVVILIIAVFMLAKYTQITYHTKDSVLDKNNFRNKKTTSTITEPLEFQHLNTKEVMEFKVTEFNAEEAKQKMISDIIVLAESVSHQIVYCINNAKATKLVGDVNDLLSYCDEFPDIYPLVVELQELADELYDATVDELLTSDEMLEQVDDTLYGNRKNEIVMVSNRLVKEMVQILFPQ